MQITMVLWTTFGIPSLYRQEPHKVSK